MLWTTSYRPMTFTSFVTVTLLTLTRSVKAAKSRLGLTVTVSFVIEVLHAGPS